MNANRRRQINEVIDRIGRLEEMVNDIVSLIEDIRDDEENAFDNLPESLQYSDRGDVMQEAIDNMSSASSDLEDICFDDIVSYLTDAMA